MDDLIESVPTLKDAKKLASDMEKVLITGGFQIKEWMYSYNASHVQSILPVTPNTATERSLVSNGILTKMNFASRSS